jgi:tyrosyl-tRNA synthetase
VTPLELHQDLEARGLLAQCTTPDFPAWLAKQQEGGKRPTVYCGFDPTADSLHLGSLLPALALRRFRDAGCLPIALVGGATGMIGDPSGKSAERSLLDDDALARNVAGLTKQMQQLVGGEVGRDFLLEDNATWFRGMGFIQFLRDVGKRFTVNMMVAKESVRARLEDRDQGISYTEFSYMLLQAYDFAELRRRHGCLLQIGGSDQWGNITAGIDLVKKLEHGADPQGLTMPLLTKADGGKFGKSERGNIWLDAKKTHPYFMHKFLFDAADADVGTLLRRLTFLPLARIAELDAATAERPQHREGQRALAAEIVGLVHGQPTADACAGLEAAMHADDAADFERHADALGLLNPDAGMSAEDAALLPVAHRPLAALDGEGLSAADLGVELGLFGSRGDVKRELAGGGGFLIAGERVPSLDFRLTRAWLGDRRVVQIKKGKKQKRMVCFR